MKLQKAVPKAAGLGKVVGDVQRRHASVRTHLLEHAADFLATRIVQRAQGFVETEHARLEGQRAPKGHPLRFSAAQSGGKPIQQRPQTELAK